jgi:hypothetical protein
MKNINGNIYSDAAINALYQDTLKLLENYRNIVWNFELSVQQVIRKLKIECGGSIEDFLESLRLAEAGSSGSDIDDHIRDIKQNKKIMKSMVSAAEFIKSKHQKGEDYYWILYYTFLSPQKIANASEIVEKLRSHIRKISCNTYYRKRHSAIEMYNSVFWSLIPQSKETITQFLSANSYVKG